MVRLAFLALTLAGVFWGLGFPLGKLALRETDAAHMILLRFAVAGLVSLPFALKSRVLYGVAFVVQFEGLAHMSVTLAALLVGLMPAFIAVCAFVMREPVTRASWTGVVAATLGAVLIAGRPGGAGSPLGIALSIAALLVFLAWLVVLRRAPKSDDAMAVPAVTVVIAAVAILPIALALHGAPRLDLSPVAWAGIAGQGVLSTVLATAAWQYGASRVGSASAGVFINIEPLMGSAIGVLAFHDRLTWAVATGGLMILAGSVVVVLGEKGAAPDLADTPPTPA